ncbi:hypothetical protein OA58_22430 [Microcystis aeruginosa NIES-88]|nr:hypothetical protein OA58_22430 [Microcystis aeruginosa NIES-88]
MLVEFSIFGTWLGDLYKFRNRLGGSASLQKLDFSINWNDNLSFAFDDHCNCLDLMEKVEEFWP